MPLTSAGWVVPTSGQIIAEIQADLTDRYTAAGLQAPSYVDTHEGILTEHEGVTVQAMEQRAQALLDAANPSKAVGANLDAIYAPRIPRLGGVASRYIFRATATSSPQTYTAGDIVAAPDGSRWAVAETTTVATSETSIPFVALAVGPTTLDSAITLAKVTAKPGIGPVTYNPADGDIVQIGRNRETDGVYRVRAQRLRGAVPGPTPFGIRAALLVLPWLRAVSLARTGQTIAITVVPGPATTAQQADLAAAMQGAIGWPAETSGGASYALDLPGGGTEVYRWSVGTALACTVTLAYTLAANADEDETDDAVTDAVGAYFEGLSTGDDVVWWHVLTAIDAVAGVGSMTALSITAGASTADALGETIVTSSTQQATLSAVVIS